MKKPSNNKQIRSARLNQINNNAIFCVSYFGKLQIKCNLLNKNNV